MRYLLLLALLAGCAMITQPVTPEASRIEVVVAAPLAVAYSRTLDGFLAERLTVGPGSQPNGLLVSEPTTFGNMGNPLTYRALLIAVDPQHTRVILSGTIRDGLHQERPLHNRMNGWLKETWERLQRIAAVLTRGASR